VRSDSFYRQSAQSLAGLSCKRELSARGFSLPLIEVRRQYFYCPMQLKCGLLIQLLVRAHVQT
jgi:hypothetical protein